jgi:hypothetical protein
MKEIERLKLMIHALNISQEEKIKMLINLQISEEINWLMQELNELRRILNEK